MRRSDFCSLAIRSMLWAGLTAVSLSLLATGLAGCAWFKRSAAVESKQHESAVDEIPSWGQRYRSPDKEVRSTGVNTRAQDIERSLGVE